MSTKNSSTPVVIDASNSQLARLHSVPLTAVTLADSFWAPLLEKLREVTLPSQYQQLEDTGRIDNFRRVAGKVDKHFQGWFFNDSDVYKVIEGAAYALHLHPEPALETYVDGVIDKIAAAQEEDGYLYTSRTILNPDNMPPGGVERWSHIQHGHELYCVGHMYEAAVAYFHGDTVPIARYFVIFRDSQIHCHKIVHHCWARDLLNRRMSLA